MKRFIVFLSTACLAAAVLFAQPVETGETAPVAPPVIPASNSGSIRAFRQLQIGMSIEQAKNILQKDPYFNYRGDPDVYFTPTRQQTLIECTGNGYIKRAYLQFVDERLFAFIIDLNEELIDYYTLYRTFEEKYGAFREFSPQYVTWEKQEIRLSLEKPLTVKYLDIKKFTQIKDEGRAVQTEEAKSLEQFLEEF
ncbi:MAG: hypothetical protein EHM28_01880 [Spirochaetaceae bacterium]|nr:MAG: hypothetical protein EHM28_01880 [Spirochaetaceae bacterium]